MTGVIYRISCSKSAKFYIGSAMNPKKRWSGHLTLLRRGKHHCCHLQRAFNRHGEAAFRFQVVEVVADRLFLLSREQFWLWRSEGHLYNTSPTAFSPLGVKHSKATRVKQSQRMVGNRLRRGKIMPAAAKKAISASLARNQYRAGIAHRAEDREKISAGLKKAFREGRRPPVDTTISTRNLAEWNAKVQSGAILLPWRKEERNQQLITFHAETKSLKKTAERFGIKPGSAWEIIKKYKPEQLRAWRRQHG